MTKRVTYDVISTENGRDLAWRIFASSAAIAG